MKKRLILVGGGDFGRELINWAEDAAAGGKGERFSGFLDRNSAVLDKYSYHLPWLGTPDDFVPEKDDFFVLGIASPESKCKVVKGLKDKGAIFSQFIHSSAVIARTAILGEGVVICPQALISCDAHIGNFVAINGLSSIGHDVQIGDFATLSAHVDLTGFVEVGAAVFFGTGAKVLPKVKIGNNARIGAGTTIMRSVPEAAVMYTLPAKRM